LHPANTDPSGCVRHAVHAPGEANA
jgi:hypothetical protein